jgi:DNA (cytosine-5)-methyltransferase 1
VKILDLYCKAGGASMGYAQAGHEVHGVDIVYQKNYPFKFIHANALEVNLDDYDFVSASPPCRDHTTLSAMVGTIGNGWLLEATRSKLEKWGGPYVIENVMGAPLRKDLVLCGTMFKLKAAGHALKRHRIFEFKTPVKGPSHSCHGWRVKGVYGSSGTHPTSKKFNAVEAREAMGIDWMTHDELTQAIPPAYTKWIAENYL